MMMLTGLRPTAPPTACADKWARPRSAAMCFAIAPYVIVSPHALLKLRSRGIQREREIRSSPGEITVEPFLCSFKNRQPALFEGSIQCARKILLPPEPEPRQGFSVRCEKDFSERRKCAADILHPVISPFSGRGLCSGQPAFCPAALSCRFFTAFAAEAADTNAASTIAASAPIPYGERNHSHSL